MAGPKVLVEIKPPDDAALVGRVLDRLFEHLDHVGMMVQSFDAANLRHARDRSRHLLLGFLVEDEGAIATALDSPADFVLLDYLLVDRDVGREIKGRGKHWGTWTVNTESDLRRLAGFEPAPSMVITDEPLLAKTVFEPPP